MKSFKTFLEEKVTSSVIFNSHGSHHNLNITEKKFVQDTLDHDLDSEFLNKNDNRHLGKSVDDQMDKLHELHPASEEHVKHLHKFTQNSRNLTEHLVEKHKSGQKPLPYYNGHDLNGLDSSFQPAKIKLNTYSGAGFDLRDATPSGRSRSGNKTYEVPTYMSSSHKKDVATRFARLNKLDGKNYQIIHWQTEPGDPIAVVGKHSDYKYEMETLHPRTHSTAEKYHIEHLGTTTYIGKTGEKYDVHHVKRIPESKVIKPKK